MISAACEVQQPVSQAGTPAPPAPPPPVVVLVSPPPPSSVEPREGTSHTLTARGSAEPSIAKIDWTGRHLFGGCAPQDPPDEDASFHPTPKCVFYSIDVTPDGGVGIEADGWMTMIRLHGRGGAKANDFVVRFVACDPDNQFDCRYKEGDPLLTLVRKADGSTSLRFDDGTESMMSTKELPELPPVPP